MESDGLKKGSATLPKEHYEKSVKDIPCGGSRYSTDNEADLDERASGLSSFVKSKKNTK
jgi:hypothetical protein